ERGDSGKIWASMLKEAIKRRKPDFSESYYGFRTFGNLLEEAQARGLLEFGRDEKSNTFVYKSNGAGSAAANRAGNNVSDKVSDRAGEQAESAASAAPEAVSAVAMEEGQAKPERRRSRGGRKPAARGNGGRTGSPERSNMETVQAEPSASAALTVPVVANPVSAAPSQQVGEAIEQNTPAAEGKVAKKAPRKTTGSGGSGRAKKAASVAVEEAAPAKAERKSAPRARRPRKAEAAEE
ncbi:OST-HTH/LOTUS domain-containing protein, partial [Undibacterium sp.]|uniref:OST-HTH/LOTUS domain-containing protein n=1 Tax=Undibacterium sp. TaxID=1914977 RepID=UPI00374D1E68